MLAMSTAVSNAVRAHSNQEPVQLQRAVRGLIGWMRPTDAKASLAGPGIQPTAEHEAIAQRACAAVTARPVGLDQTGALSDVPNELADHVQQLKDNAASALYFNEGWRVVVADLTRVCAMQPHVATDDSSQRAAGLSGDDIRAVAQVTLPVGSLTPIAAAFNEDKKAWVFSSANPNLRVFGHAQGDAPVAPIFGFAVGVSLSFMQVASFNGRLLLRDGYHRAYGLLRRGITRAPVFVREFERFEDMRLPSGMLPQDAYLGLRPPTLADYLNDEVSAEGAALVTQKVVIIQALEVATLG
jgi:hypothetical protein